MPTKYLLCVLSCIALLTGCQDYGMLVKRESELNCPTDIRKTVPWCAGEDAVFCCPCGPNEQFHGHKPTCWRPWQSSGAEWRDLHCEPIDSPCEIEISGSPAREQAAQPVEVLTPTEPAPGMPLPDRREQEQFPSEIPPTGDNELLPEPERAPLQQLELPNNGNSSRIRLQPPLGQKAAVSSKKSLANDSPRPSNQEQGQTTRSSLATIKNTSQNRLVIQTSPAARHDRSETGTLQHSSEISPEHSLQVVVDTSERSLVLLPSIDLEKASVSLKPLPFRVASTPVVPAAGILPKTSGIVSKSDTVLKFTPPKSPRPLAAQLVVMPMAPSEPPSPQASLLLVVSSETVPAARPVKPISPSKNELSILRVAAKKPLGNEPLRLVVPETKRKKSNFKSIQGSKMLFVR